MSSTKMLVGTMIDYNIPDEHGNVPLHTAVIRNDWNMLNHLLQQSTIDVNYKNYKGETPLMLCLRQSRTDSFILRLIQSGSNLSLTNSFGQTCLHVALLCSSVNIAHNLIENGADVNAMDRDKRSALHYAVDNNDLEAVCMLLYYGIDVSTLCNDNMTAFTLALYNNKLDLAEALFDYYDDFSDVDQDGYTALHWAAKHESPLALKLVEAGADVNCVPTYDNNALIISLHYNNAELFKLIWPKFDHHLLLEGTTSFIEQFISDTDGFSANDWVECMYLILESPAAFDLLNHYRSLLYVDDDTTPCSGCFVKLIIRLKQLEVERNDRIGIIASCLSLGWETNEKDINLAFVLYGFGQELELFIYGADVYDRLSYGGVVLPPLPLYIYALGGELISNDIVELLRGQIREIELNEDFVKPVLHSLGFFAPSIKGRRKLQWECNHLLPNYQAILQRLNNSPEFPSLLELARNKTRQYIRQKYRVYRAYHMHDAVKGLNLPKRIQDIILFKTPLYHFK